MPTALLPVCDLVNLVDLRVELVAPERDVRCRNQDKRNHNKLQGQFPILDIALALEVFQYV